MTNYQLPRSMLKSKECNNKVVGFRISEDLNDKINEIAKANNITKTEVIKIAINNLIK